jgi:hypothetical protein
VTVPVRCPRCAVGVVRVQASTWPTSLGPAWSAWADEPLSCSAGCVLAPAQVQRLLVGVFEVQTASGGGYQLPLFAGGDDDEEAAA